MRKIIIALISIVLTQLTYSQDKLADVPVFVSNFTPSDSFVTCKVIKSKDISVLSQAGMPKMMYAIFYKSGDDTLYSVIKDFIEVEKTDSSDMQVVSYKSKQSIYQLPVFADSKKRKRVYPHGLLVPFAYTYKVNTLFQKTEFILKQGSYKPLIRKMPWNLAKEMYVVKLL